MNPFPSCRLYLGMKLAVLPSRSPHRIGKGTTMMFMTYTLPMAAMLIGLATYWMVTKLW